MVVKMFAMTVERDRVSQIPDTNLAVKIVHGITFKGGIIAFVSEERSYVSTLTTIDAGGPVKRNGDVKLEILLV